MKKRIDCTNDEPENVKFELPSEKEHFLCVCDVFTSEDEMGQKLGLDENTISVKCEVGVGDELGRTLLHRLTLDPSNRGFFATRLFLKAINLEYKGSIEINTDDFQNRRFYAKIIHNQGANGKTYANIEFFNFDKPLDQPIGSKPIPAAQAGEKGWDE